MKTCECCKRKFPESSIFKRMIKGVLHNICGVCYTNIEEYEKNKRENTFLSREDIKKIELKNEQETKRIKEIDFAVLPREHLEDVLNFIRKKDFNQFKIIILEMEEIKRFP